MTPINMVPTILKQNGKYSEVDVLLFEKEMQLRHFYKGDVLIKEGTICKSVYYLIDGAVVQYGFRKEIDQNIIDLHCKNEWFLDHRSFVAQQPASHQTEAYTDVTVYELSVESIHSLIAKSPAFLQLGKLLDKAIERIHFFDSGLSPFQKYEYLLRENPRLFQQYPLKMIASYLKITPETLSRVRDKYARGITGS